MDFDLCAHGNIGMTCPQCRGRQPAASGAVSGFGLPTQRMPKAGTYARKQIPEDDKLETLYDSVKGADARFNIILGGMLEDYIEDAEKKVLDTSDRRAREVKGFWQQINPTTTVAEHDQLRNEQ